MKPVGVLWAKRGNLLQWIQSVGDCRVTEGYPLGRFAPRNDELIRGSLLLRLARFARSRKQVKVFSWRPWRLGGYIEVNSTPTPVDAHQMVV